MLYLKLLLMWATVFAIAYLVSVVQREGVDPTVLIIILAVLGYGVLNYATKRR